ncbi:MAG: single-stranded-DNA-specific exonuclease RecJ, partial [Rhodobacterales bacterium]|nr:single-stranded-DNA-specific exonuclease RecJ [Rhodobacterales bacterium]
DAGPLVLVAGEGWHPGVVGIVASRLKDRFNRPACVVALDGDRGQASGRSVSGVDLGAAVIAARQAGLLEKGGGHAMAAGFTVARDRLPAVRDFLADRLRTAAEGTDLVPRLYLDGGVAPRGATEDLVRTLAQAGPFGAGNPEPRFVLKGVRLTHAAPVGKDQNHLRCTLADDSGGRVDGIAFRCMDGDLGPALLRHDGAPFHVAGKLRLNNWQGRTSVQVMIDDAAPVW